LRRLGSAGTPREAGCATCELGYVRPRLLTVMGSHRVHRDSVTVFQERSAPTGLRPTVGAPLRTGCWPSRRLPVCVPPALDRGFVNASRCYPRIVGEAGRGNPWQFELYIRRLFPCRYSHTTVFEERATQAGAGEAPPLPAIRTARQRAVVRSVRRAHRIWCSVPWGERVYDYQASRGAQCNCKLH
jgi:hypothetical protein